MFRLIPYTESFSDQWDSTVEESDNGHFMFKRNYLNYHKDRFDERSFLVFKDEEVVGIIPGNKSEKIWITHEGLSFGGLILKSKFNRAIYYREILDILFATLKDSNIEKLIYKFIPHIYHRNPCEADFYFLQFSNIEKIIVEISTTINLFSNSVISQLRIRGKKKAQKEGVIISESNNFSCFWNILARRLGSKYEKSPTHSLEEILLLKSHYQNNIRLFIAEHPIYGICGGAVIYENETVAHAQYISASEEGMKAGALDMLFINLIDFYKEKNLNFFDFGISTERKGVYLNENLVNFKEGFGGKPTTCLTINMNI